MLPCLNQPGNILIAADGSFKVTHPVVTPQASIGTPAPATLLTASFLNCLVLACLSVCVCQLGDLGHAIRADGSMRVEEGDERYLSMDVLRSIDLFNISKVHHTDCPNGTDVARAGPGSTSGCSGHCPHMSVCVCVCVLVCLCYVACSGPGGARLPRHPGSQRHLRTRRLAVRPLHAQSVPASHAPRADWPRPPSPMLMAMQVRAGEPQAPGVVWPRLPPPARGTAPTGRYDHHHHARLPAHSRCPPSYHMQQHQGEEGGRVASTSTLSAPC